MRIQLVGKFVGKLTILLGLSMVFPLLWALYYQEAASSAFCISIGITIAAGIVFMLLCHPHPEDTLRQREGFAMVTLGWLVATIFGSLPFLLTGVVASPVDAIFETMSGFTTTGASIFPDVEVLPKSILMWRSLTQWLGGLGIVVLFVALLAIGPGGSAGGGMLIRAEYSGGSLADRISPRMSDTAKALWLTYFGLSVAMLILLRLGGMSFFDSFVHTFATVSTGGFSSKNASMGFYDGNGFLQWVVIIFMFLSGANIALYYFLLVQRKGALWKSGEFRCYLTVTLICAGLICLDLMTHGTFSEEGVAYSFRQALFQVVSVMTTTGFASADYNMWPVFSVFLLFLLFFSGGCQGSTSGAIKISRWLLLFKNGFAELQSVLHPKAVRRVRINGRPVSAEMVDHITQFFAFYMLFFFFGALALSACGLPFLEAISASATAIGNVGPGLGAVGPASNFALLPMAGKIIMTLLMLFGRLEIFTVLVLFLPSFWKK